MTHSAPAEGRMTSKRGPRSAHLWGHPPRRAAPRKGGCRFILSVPVIGLLVALLAWLVVA